jgi:hypothetical protein
VIGHVAAGAAVSAALLLLPDARIALLPYWLLVLIGTGISLSAARSLSGTPVWVLAAAAALLRAILVPAPPALSDDVWRYLWDGEVAAAGLSPWAHAPDSPALDGVAPALRSRVAHPEIATVYPPVAQAAFLSASLFEPSLAAWKTLVAAADTGVVVLLAASGSPSAAALYAFHPLPVTEAAREGHVDSLGVALLLCALLLAGRGRAVSSGLVWAAAVLTKYPAAVALLPLARAGRYRFAATAAAALAALWLAAWLPGASPFGGFSAYATRWEFNAILFPAARASLEALGLPGFVKEGWILAKEGLGHPEWMSAVFPYFHAGFLARVLLALLLAATVLVVAAREKDLWRATFLSIAALLLVSPTLHPWYLLWILPFAARARSPAWLWLASAAPLSYALLSPRPPLSRGVVLVLEWLPFAALTLLSLSPSMGRGRVRG